MNVRLIKLDYLKRVLEQENLSPMQIQRIIQSAMFQNEPYADILEREESKLIIKAAELGIKAANDGTLKESEAVRILQKSKDYLSSRVSMGKSIPNYKPVGYCRRYTITDLATWNLENLKVK